MELNKKAFFFTTIAIALSVVIILSYNVYTNYKLKDEMGVIETRINTMDSFIKDLENDLENAIFIVGFRSLLSIEDYMMDQNKFLNDANPPATPALNTAFKDVFEKGTINSQSMFLMRNNTFLNWTERMKIQADKTDILLDFTVNSVTISHSEPWKVDISVNLDIDIKDKKNTATWAVDNKIFTKQINISSEISGNHRFVDPLYLVNNNGKVNNTIRKTTVPDFSGGNLVTHLNNNYYIENTDSPSYLMRFENDSSSSVYGIESLANVDLISSLSLGPSGKTAVDHLYFDPGSSTTDCNIEGMEISHPWFYLDSDHLGFYGAVCV